MALSRGSGYSVGDILPQVGQDAEVVVERLRKSRDSVIEVFQIFIVVAAEIQDLDGLGPGPALSGLLNTCDDAGDLCAVIFTGDRDIHIGTDSERIPFIEENLEIMFSQKSCDTIVLPVSVFVCHAHRHCIHGTGVFLLQTLFGMQPPGVDCRHKGEERNHTDHENRI